MKQTLQATTIAIFTMLLALPAYAQQGYQQYPAQAYQPVYQANPAYGQPYVQPVVYQQNMAQPQNMIYHQPQAMVTNQQPNYQQPQVMPTSSQINYQKPQIARQPISYADSQTSQGYPQDEDAALNNDPDSYNTTSSNSMSPYEQQELALKEAKMLQQLEDMKHSRDNSESFRKMGQGASGNLTERGYVAKSASRGGLGGAIRGLGSALKSGARVAGPAATSIGASVGTFFLIRSINQ